MSHRPSGLGLMMADSEFQPAVWVLLRSQLGPWAWGSQACMLIWLTACWSGQLLTVLLHLNCANSGMHSCLATEAAPAPSDASKDKQCAPLEGPASPAILHMRCCMAKDGSCGWLASSSCLPLRISLLPPLFCHRANAGATSSLAR